MDWNLILAALINSVMVLIIVQLLRVYVVPAMKETYPFVYPIIALIIGPIIGGIQSWLAELIGLPIDLSMIIAIFSGGTAVAFYQIRHQYTKYKKLKGGKI